MASNNDPLGLFESQNNDPLGLFSDTTISEDGLLNEPVAQAKPYTPNVDTEKTEKFKTDNPLSASFLSGATKLVQTVADTPKFAADVVNEIAVNPFLHLFGKDLPGAKRFEFAQDLEAVSKELTTDLRNKPVEDLSLSTPEGRAETANWIAQQAAAQSPQIVNSTAASFIPKLRAAYLGFMGATSGADSNVENERAGVDDQRRVLAGISDGAWEVVGEALPFEAFDKVGGLIKRLPDSEKAAFISDITKKTLAATAAATAQHASEGIGEMATQAGQNWTARDIAGNENVDIGDGVLTSGAIGAIMATPSSVAHGVQAFRADHKSVPEMLAERKPDHQVVAEIQSSPTLDEAVQKTADAIETDLSAVDADLSALLQQSGQGVTEATQGEINANIIPNAGTPATETAMQPPLAGNDDQPGGMQGQEAQASSPVNLLAQAAGSSSLLTAEQPAPPIATSDRRELSRRGNVDLRQQFESMTPEDRASALDDLHRKAYVSDLTGLPNKRAFDEHVTANPDAKVLYGDVDGLKALNTRYGHNGADQILKAVGEVKAAVASAMGINAFHRSGDEFLAVHPDPAILKSYGDEVQKRLDSATVEVTLPDGSVEKHIGIGLSYGVGQNEDIAEKHAEAQKAERKSGTVPVQAAGRVEDQPSIPTETQTKLVTPVSKREVTAEKLPVIATKPAEIAQKPAETTVSAPITEQASTPSSTSATTLIFGTNSAGRITLRGVPGDKIKAVRDKLKLKDVIIGFDNAVFPKGTNVEALKAEFGIVAEKPQPKPRKQNGKSGDLITRIKQIGQQLGGGISSEYMEGAGAKDATFNIKAAFKKDGRSPDEFAKILRDEGYPISEDNEIADLQDLISQYIGGRRTFKAEAIEDVARTEADDRAFAELIPDAEKHGIDWKKFKSPDDLYIAITKAEDALNDAEAAALDVVLGDEEIDIDSIPESTAEQITAWMGESDAKGNTESPTTAADEKPNQSAERSQESAETPVLESYTNAEVLARESAKARAEEEARAADAKDKADKEVGDFTLTGSNRAADVGAANGQTDIFSQSETQSKKLEVLKAQAQGKISGDQGAALKELADAGEHAAVDEVLKPKTTEPAISENKENLNQADVAKEQKSIDKTGGIMFSKAAPADQTKTAAFRKWAGTDKPVIEPNEINDTDFRGEGPFVMRAYHGTTHDFNVFDASIKGNKEGQFGQVNYFTSSEYDASDNYAGEGPDLTSRIDQKAEKLISDLEYGNDDELDGYDVAQIEELRARISDETINAFDKTTMQMARNIVKQELHGGEERTLELFIKTNKPFVVGGDKPSRLELYDRDAIRTDAEEQIADEEGISVEELRDDPENQYEDKINEREWEILDTTENPLAEAIQNVASRYDADPSELLSKIYDLSSDGEIRHTDLEKELRGDETINYAEDPETGELVQSQIIGEILQELGFDSIILKDAGDRFANMNIVGGTAHIHIFDANNTNIKSATDNRGTFDQNDANILHSRGDSVTNETPETIAQALRDNPNTSKYADTLLKRGDEGKKGGIVIAKDIESLPDLFKEKTGVELGEDVLQSVARSEYFKRADQIERALNAMGLRTEQEKSRQSLSTYVYAYAPEGSDFKENEGEYLKIRVSDHKLPDSYIEPDFDVMLGEGHDGSLMNNYGTWDEAVEFVAKQFNMDVPPVIKRLDSLAKTQASKAANAAKEYRAKDARRKLEVAKIGTYTKSASGNWWLNKDSGSMAQIGKMPEMSAEQVKVAYIERLEKELAIAESEIGSAQTNPDIRYSKSGKVQALYDPKSGLTFMVANHLTKETAPAVALHEIVHATDTKEIRAQAAKLIEQRNNPALPAKLRAFLNSVNDRMESAGVAGDEMESASYIVEQALLLGRQDGFSAIDNTIFAHLTDKLGARVGNLVREWVAMVRAALLKRGIAIKLTVDDLIALAKAGMKQSAQGDVNTGDDAMANSRGEQSAESFARMFMEEFVAENGEAFKHDRNSSKNLATILDEVADATYAGDGTRADEQQESLADERHFFTTKNGHQFKVYETQDSVWIDVLNLEEGSGGQAIYAAVANYAYNTGKKFIGDPDGLTAAAVIRRTSNMLSSAMRFGTTRHIEPSNQQINATNKKGDPLPGVEPLEWRGSDIDKIEALAHTLVTTTQNLFPEIKRWRYDFNTKTFRDGEGQPISAAALSSLRQDDGRGMDDAQRLGESTARRVVLYQTLLSEASEGVGRRSQILEELLNWGNRPSSQGKGGYPDNLTRLFSRAQSNIETETQDKALPEETKTEAVRRVAQDTMLRFKVVQDWLKTQGVDIAESANVYQHENLGKSKTANKLEDFRNFEVAPLIQKIADAKFKLNDIVDYLEAVHIPEANARMRKIHGDKDATANGVTDEQAKAVEDEFKKLPNFDKFKKLAEEVRSIGSQTLDMRLAEGLITQEQYDAYKSTYQNWVPLRGDMAGKQGFGKGMSTNAKSKRRFGHESRENEFIFENLVADRERAIFQIEHNKLGKVVANFLLTANNPDIGTVDKPVKQSLQKDFSYAVIHDGQVISAFETKGAAQAFILKTVNSKNGAIQGFALTPADFSVEKSYDPHVVMMTKPMLAENEIQVYFKGQTIRLQLNDPLLARAATNAGIEQLAGMLYVARKINNFLSKAYTAWSPDFLVVNPVRDIYQGTVVITGKRGAQFSAKTMANYASSWMELWKAHNDPRTSKWVTRYRKAGGNTGGAYMSDIERVGRDAVSAFHEFAGAAATYDMVMAEQRAKGASISKAKLMALSKAAAAGGHKIPALGHFLRLMERLNGVFENTLRLAAFKTAIEAGETDQQAGQLAKDLMNFNRKGEIANQMGAAYLFFNPSMQGAHVVLESILTSPHKNQARMIVGGLTMAAFMLAEMGRGGDDDDERDWRNIPDYVKARNLVIKIGDTQVTLPVAYGFGVFHSLGNAMSDVMHGVDSEKAGINMADAMFENFSVFGNPLVEQDGKVEFHPEQMTPTLIKMVTAPANNLDSLGRRIAPIKYQASKPDSENMTRALRGSTYASIAATLNDWTGGNNSQPGFVDVSPNVLKYWVTSITGGAGRFSSDIADAVTGGVVPEIENVPVVRKFVRTSDVADSRAAFWNVASKAKIAAEQYRSAIRNGDKMTVYEMKRDMKPYLALAKMADHVADMAGAKRNAIDKIRHSDITASEKKERILQIEKQEQAIYDRFLNAFDRKQAD